VNHRVRIHRFHAADLSPSRVVLSAEESHHAAAVLRLRPGALVELFDGTGRVARGSILQTSRGTVTVAVNGRRSVARGAPVVHLAFAVPKAKRLNWLLEKSTELSAASLTPAVFRRSVAGATGDKPPSSGPRRWMAHCIPAAKQCGLNFLPQIRPSAPLETFLSSCPAGMRLLGDCSEGAAPLQEALTSADTLDGDAHVVLVGPEGGLTDDERQAALAADFLPVRLGETTLRTETAAVALLAAVVAMRSSGRT